MVKTHTWNDADRNKQQTGKLSPRHHPAFYSPVTLWEEFNGSSLAKEKLVFSDSVLTQNRAQKNGFEVERQQFNSIKIYSIKNKNENLMPVQSFLIYLNSLNTSSNKTTDVYWMFKMFKALFSTAHELIL